MDVKNRATEESIKKITKLISENLGVDVEKVVPQAKLAEDLGADSLDTVELVMKLEEEFKIEIDDSEAEKISTVQDVVDFILEKGGSSPSGNQGS